MTFRTFLFARHGTLANTLLDRGEAPRSYRDVLAKRERFRPNGAPVWPITDADLSSRVLPAIPAISAQHNRSRAIGAGAGQGER